MRKTANWNQKSLIKEPFLNRERNLFEMFSNHFKDRVVRTIDLPPSFIKNFSSDNLEKGSSIRNEELKHIQEKTYCSIIQIKENVEKFGLYL